MHFCVCQWNNVKGEDEATPSAQDTLEQSLFFFAKPASPTTNLHWLEKHIYGAYRVLHADT